jgi:hypothetical protein
MNIPEGYEPMRLNTMAGDTVAHLICRRPDGGVSDIRMTLKTPALAGVCPACGRDMVSAKDRPALLTCKTGHILIKMTTAETTAAHFNRSPAVETPPTPKRITSMRKAAPTFPALRTHTRTTTTDADIRAAVEEAMKEMKQ